mgnify:CR=1 FL=1
MMGRHGQRTEHGRPGRGDAATRQGSTARRRSRDTHGRAVQIRASLHPGEAMRPVLPHRSSVTPRPSDLLFGSSAFLLSRDPATDCVLWYGVRAGAILTAAAGPQGPAGGRAPAAIMGHVARRDRVVTPHTHPDAHAIPTPVGGQNDTELPSQRPCVQSRIYSGEKREKFPGG